MKIFGATMELARGFSNADKAVILLKKLENVLRHVKLLQNLMTIVTQ